LVEEVECPEISFKLTGLAIRDYLLATGKGSPYDFYKCFKRVNPRTSYKNIAYYFSLLRKAGLIEVVETGPSSRRGFDKTYYRIVPGMEDHPDWIHPQQIFYPETRLGKKRYKPKREGG
jgi:hypothetical protein